MALVRLNPSGCIITDERGVILHSDMRTLVLEGASVSRFVQQVLPLLDGTRSVQAITDATPAQSTTT